MDLLIAAMVAATDGADEPLGSDEADAAEIASILASRPSILAKRDASSDCRWLSRAVMRRSSSEVKSCSIWPRASGDSDPEGAAAPPAELESDDVLMDEVAAGEEEGSTQASAPMGRTLTGTASFVFSAKPAGTAGLVA